MAKKTGILFVCTGNICRSPTAEGVFRHRVREAGREADFLIDSAGIEGYHVGDPPDGRSIRYALERGFEIHDLRARRVEKADFRTFDLILAMDAGHHRALQRMKPADADAEVAMFLDFAHDLTGDDSRDVPDPYCGGPRDFTHVLDLVEKGVDGLLAHLRTKKEQA
jgi:protein-tyrosine phosphatase